MADQVRREVRRKTEDQGTRDRRADVLRQIPRQRIRARHVQEDECEQHHIVRGDEGERPKQRRRDDAGTEHVRLADHVDAEGVEQIVGAEVGEGRGIERRPHPPQIPEEGVVVARRSRDGVARMRGQRPRPGDGQYGEECQRCERPCVPHAVTPCFRRAPAPGAAPCGSDESCRSGRC